MCLNALSIDLGLNDKQENLILNSIELDYSGTKLLAQGADSAKFFRL